MAERVGSLGDVAAQFLQNAAVDNLIPSGTDLVNGICKEALAVAEPPPISKKE